MKCLEISNNATPLWILGHERATVVNFSISLNCQTSETAVYANAFIAAGAQTAFEPGSVWTEKIDLTGRIGVRVVGVDVPDKVWCESREPSTAPHPKRDVLCSFCGKSNHEVAKIIAGPNVYICNECVHLCHEIVSDMGV